MSIHLIIRGNANRLPIPNATINCCVTSPPYFGLRHYSATNDPRELGHEALISDYVNNIVKAMREVHRVLRRDGTLWLNIGDRFATARIARLNGLKSKERLLLPARTSLALQADGWSVRSDLIWNKPNATPESVIDRPTAAHEYLFLLTKSPHYYFNERAIREPSICKHPSGNGFKRTARLSYGDAKGARGNDRKWVPTDLRRSRSVWSINTKSYRRKHSGTFPPELARKCVLAGCPIDGIVLDPFAGSFTTTEAAHLEGRNSIGIELYHSYCEIGRERVLGLEP